MFTNAGGFLASEGLNIPVLSSSLFKVICRFFMHDMVGMGVVEEDMDSSERN